ncbi:hypothetical protein E1A91_A01G157600v1 [Gossypium mustelinum]|uniref:NADH dehydrogenase [ubiquinone] 1 beta subcomplex subunit 7 n=2 Tax=Gossypium TaxID=3633 RepID=A0A5D3AHY9_GOSMU|nr:hypothetical protein ES288_A01G165400v1 [Gossypium darwinii]TYJ49761.1 hypothetical protein E1A91_A01G157600v1 [Gossypium mustelinum]
MEMKGSSKKMMATEAEMVENKVPIPYRDQCAHLLFKCEYELVRERMLQMQKIHEEEAKLKQSGKQVGSIPLIPNTANA